jgi:putative oxidoreductase
MLLNSEPVSADVGLLALRLGAGGTLFWQHGWPKLIGFAELMDKFGDPIGLGSTISLGLIVLAETVCAGLVVLGLWTRITTVPVIIGMAVAAFIVHGGGGFAKQELAVLYGVAFVVLFFTGSGRYSLDRLSFS